MHCRNPILTIIVLGAVLLLTHSIALAYPVRRVIPVSDVGEGAGYYAVITPKDEKSIIYDGKHDTYLAYFKFGDVEVVEDRKLSGKDTKSSGKGKKSSGKDTKSSGKDAKSSKKDAKSAGKEAGSAGKDTKSSGEDAKSTGREAGSSEERKPGTQLMHATLAKINSDDVERVKNDRERPLEWFQLNLGKDRSEAMKHKEKLHALMKDFANIDGDQGLGAYVENFKEVVRSFVTPKPETGPAGSPGGASPEAHGTSTKQTGGKTSRKGRGV
ncbi:hypothetical protein LshimejAT787_0601770 [Lyophyllum shimeji]|uniref:Uncharacterized protein n=1 Tax=Lyophyllum shimeji TaxID=47721 RepID=A0A9P3PME5_LYOSH|nr:hypothetical protein LshimejAT787_0601770 [Lyophyllum shimeji]